MKRILALGAGGPLGVLVNYLSQYAGPQGWELKVIDDINTPAAIRQQHMHTADVVVSLLPASLNQIVAEECLAAKKHLLTSSPVNEKIMNLRQQAEGNLLFLYELGFEPGLDHMSALQLINHIYEQGGKITSFHTHSGRLPVSDNDENPWRFKTGNAKQLVRQANDTAVYKEKGQVVHLKPTDLFSGARLLEVPGIGFLSWFPHHDSLGYIPLYGLTGAETVVRTTLCHPDFIYGWKNVTDLKLTDENAVYDIEGMTLADFFKLHLDKQGFNAWLEQKMMERLTQTRQILEKLMQFMEVEQQANEGGQEFPDNLMIVDEKGKLENIDLDEVKDNAAALVAYKMHEANLTLKQLFYLGMDDKQTIIDKGRYSAANILQLSIENKLSFAPNEPDMAVMLHEAEYELNGKRKTAIHYLVLKNNEGSAVDKITGLTLGIAVNLLLTEKISLRGLQIPIRPEIYEPVMKELAENGIVFKDLA
jgi:saccharopine dehydrogenase-like NADP-dependent oxidoreductase